MTKNNKWHNFGFDHPDFVTFPNPQLADDSGLLGSGGDLEPETLLSAYLQGVFPWFNQGQPILWWSPNPRLILHCDKFHTSRSFRKRLKNQQYRVSCDTAFNDVIKNCASQAWRRDISLTPEGTHTWITDQMLLAYQRLFELGYAHSIEVWDNDNLVGGLYGVSINNLFFGESMFSAASDASKIALFYLCKFLKKHDCPWLDCQVESDHLLSLGAELINRHQFIQKIKHHDQKSLPWCNFASEASSIML